MSSEVIKKQLFILSIVFFKSLIFHTVIALGTKCFGQFSMHVFHTQIVCMHEALLSQIVCTQTLATKWK